MISLPSADDAIALVLTSSLTAASGAVHVRSRAPLAFGLVALSALVTFVIPLASPAVLFVCAGLSALALFRNLDLYRDTEARGVGFRVAHTLAGFDVRRVRRVAPAFDRRAWLRVICFGAVTFIAAALVIELAEAQNLGARFAYGVAGLVWAYASFDALTALVRAVYRLFGVEVPPLHDDPIVSRSLAEFWGRRWNLMVERMLHDHAFRPVARRAGVGAAVLAAFGASALLHFWLLMRSGGLAMAVSMGGFFLVHGVLVLVERAIGVRRFPRWLGHVWTVTALLATLPLFLPPLLYVAFRAD